ncbi:hypothetical protein KQH27_00690 [bacterium]|nr:hypothetical protein [bacterium]
MLIYKNKVYELSLSSIKEEHLNDFLQKYIPSIFPIMAEYGGRFIISGLITNSVTAKYPVKSFALLEWPSIEQFSKIVLDDRVTPLLDLRNKYLNYIIEGCFYNVDEDTELLVPENKSMYIFLSNRNVSKNQKICFRWLDSPYNRKLSSNLYLSNSSIESFDENIDIDELYVKLNNKRFNQPFERTR